MCKTPSHFCSHGHGSLAASWARPGDPRSALDGPQRRLSCSRSAVLLALAVFAGEGSRDDALATVGVAAILVAAARARGGRARGSCRSGGSTGRALAVVVGATSRSPPGRALDRLVDRRRPLVGVARPRARLPGVPRARRSLGGALAPGARARRRGRARSSSRRRSRWALLGVAVPSLFEDGDRIARLREPVGYWNALALLADGGARARPLAARAPAARARASGGLLLATAATSRCCSPSRGRASSARVAVLALWLVLSARLADAPARRSSPCSRRRRRRLGVHASRARRGRGAPRRPRRRRARVRGARRSPARVVVALAAWRLPVARLVAERRRLVRARSSPSRAPWLLVVGVAGVVAAVGNPSRGRRRRSRARSARTTRAGSPTSARTTGSAWWEESLEVAADRPVGGPGAGTFEIARKRVREDASSVSEPHSVPLQLLADLGARRARPRAARRRRRGRRRPPRRSGSSDEPSGPPPSRSPASSLAYGVHALVDYDLDFLAVTAPGARRLGGAAGASAARARPCGSASGPASRSPLAPRRPRSSLVALPALAEREVERSLDASRRRATSPRRSTRPSARGCWIRSRSARSRRSPTPRTRPATSGCAVALVRARRPSSSPRTRTPGTRSASTRARDRATVRRVHALNAAYTLDPNGTPVGTGRAARRHAGRRQRRGACERVSRSGAEDEDGVRAVQLAGRIPSSGRDDRDAEVAREPACPRPRTRCGT